jgi:hypothetical protein
MVAGIPVGMDDLPADVEPLSDPEGDRSGGDREVDEPSPAEPSLDERAMKPRPQRFATRCPSPACSAPARGSAQDGRWPAAVTTAVVRVLVGSSSAPAERHATYPSGRTRTAPPEVTP